MWWLFGRGQRDHVVSRRSNDCVFTKEYSRCEATPTASNVAVGAVEAADSISVCESLSTHCVMGSSRYNILILFVLFCVVRGVTLHSWSWRQDLYCFFGSENAKLKVHSIEATFGGSHERSNSVPRELYCN